MTLLLCLSVAGLSVACGILWRRQTRLDAAQAAALAAEHADAGLALESICESLEKSCDRLDARRENLEGRMDAQALVLETHGAALTVQEQRQHAADVTADTLRAQSRADADAIATLAQRVSALESQRRAPRHLARVRLEAQGRKRGAK